LIETPALQGIRNQVLAKLWEACVMDHLQADLQCGDRAMLNGVIRATQDGVLISINGFSENAEQLLERMIHAAQNCLPDRTTFSIQQSRLRRESDNFDLLSAKEQVCSLFRAACTAETITPQQLSEELWAIRHEDLLSFSHTLFHKNFVKGSLYGNLDRTDAIRIAKATCEKFFGLAYTREIAPEKKSPLPKLGEIHLLEIVSSSPNSSLLLGCQTTVRSPEEKARHNAATLLLKETLPRSIEVTSFQEDMTSFTQLIIEREKEYGVELLAHMDRLLAPLAFCPEKAVAIAKHIEESLLAHPLSLKEKGEQMSAICFQHNSDHNQGIHHARALGRLSGEEIVDCTRELLIQLRHRSLAICVRPPLERVLPDLEEPKRTTMEALKG
jgi:hypothetical protein